MERSGHVYSRISNPTNAVLEERVAALEGGAGAIVTASGQAALHLAISTIAGAGSHVVSSSALYGGSHNLLHYTLACFGIATTFVKPSNIDGWRAAIRPTPKLLFGETLGNPGLDVLGIPTVPAIAHEHGLALLVDSTFTTPWLMKPFDHGADLVFHSATKFLSGHGTVIGGVLVNSDQFDWHAAHAAHGRFVELAEPYDGFHGMVFTDESSVGAFLLRARREHVRDFDACMSPHSAWLILQGIETLPLRMARHVENTRKVVDFLVPHGQVGGVGYPELESHPSHALAKNCCRAAAGRSSASTCAARAGRAWRSSRHSGSFRTSRTSGTATRWLFTKLRLRTSAWTMRRSRRPGSRPAFSGSRSGSKMPTRRPDRRSEARSRWPRRQARDGDRCEYAP